MLYMTVTVCSKNHTIPINTSCGQNVKFSIVYLSGAWNNPSRPYRAKEFSCFVAQWCKTRDVTSDQRETKHFFPPGFVMRAASHSLLSHPNIDCLMDSTNYEISRCAYCSRLLFLLPS